MVWCAVLGLAGVGLLGCSSSAEEATASTTLALSTPSTDAPATADAVETTAAAAVETTVASRTTPAMPVGTQVKFPAGSTGTEITGHLDTRTPSMTFVLAARATQTLSLELAVPSQEPPADTDASVWASLGPRVSFSVSSPTSEPLVAGATSLVRTLPIEGQYAITVMSSSPIPADFVLTTTIVDGAAGTRCGDAQCGVVTWSMSDVSWFNGGWDIAAKVPVVLGAGAAPAMGLPTAVQNAVNEFLGDTGEGTFGTATISADVLLATPSFVALQLTYDTFLYGGAHPAISYSTLVWDAAASAAAPMDWIFVSPRTLPLEAIRTAVVAELTERGVPADSLGADLDVTTPDAVTPAVDGVRVSYGQCVVAACAAGDVSVLLPYDAWTGVLTPEVLAGHTGPLAAGA